MKNLSLEDLSQKLKPLNEDPYTTLFIVQEYILSLADNDIIDEDVFNNAINKCKSYGLLSDKVLPNVLNYLYYHGVKIESKINTK